MVERTISASRWLSADAFDERLVDLQLLAADPLQIGQRRQAGAEVVDGDRDAGLGEPVEHGQRRLRVLDDRGLGDLDGQAALGAAGLRRGRSRRSPARPACGRRC